MILNKKVWILSLQIFCLSFADTTDLAKANALLNTGNSYAINHDYPSAIQVYKKILNIFPDSPSLHYNIGYALNELTNYHEAATYFKTACSIKPDPQYYLGWATALLALGDYEQGWKLYEHRWQLPDKKNVRLPSTKWDGISSLKGKNILLINEGALGDCLQFIRYAEPIKKKGAYVTVLIPPALVNICACCPFIDQIITSISQVESIDYWTSLMSLPALLETTEQTIPQNIPYITLDPALVHYWKNSFEPNGLIKVGICWQADTANDANRPPLAKRSISPEDFYPLSCLPQVVLYSLQYAQETPFFIQNFGNSIDTIHGRFMDTAAIMCNLDLVITVDTAIAHLSGALGIPTWLLLPFKADWRWMTQRQESPWYPTMRIFRVSKNESWTTLLKTVADTLSLSLTNHQGDESW
jgi:hypothetical protein